MRDLVSTSEIKNSVFTKIFMPLANPGEWLQNQLARIEFHMPGFLVLII